MTTDLVGTVRRDLAPLAPIESFQPLDVYAGGLSDEAPRLEALATISAGYRDQQTRRPMRSKAGEIYLHKGAIEVPGLEAALAAGGGKRLTIAFPFDDPARFIQQRFMSYSASALLAYGDERGIWTIKDNGEKAAPTRKLWTPDDAAAWQRLMGEVKVAVSVYFTLAELGDDGARVVFPDGLGFYRLRFTSRNSLRAILAQLRMVAQFTRGRIAGIPFDLALDFREVADPRGQKRTIPVWTIVTRPAGGLRLTSGNFRSTMTAAIEQGRLLQLPAPAAEDLDYELAHPLPTLEDDARPEEVVQPTDEELAMLEAGGACDVRAELRWFYQNVRGTPLDDDDARAEFLLRYSGGDFDSLAAFLRTLSEAAAQEFRQAVAVRISTDRNVRQRSPEEQRGDAAEYDALFGADEAERETIAYDERTQVDPETGEMIEQTTAASGASDEDEEAEAEPDALAEAVYLRCARALKLAHQPDQVAAAIAQARAELPNLTDDQRLDLENSIALLEQAPKGGR